MVVKYLENETLEAKSGSIGGVLVYCYMVASATNNALVVGDWNPTGTQVQCWLIRGGKRYDIMTDNLQILGTYHARKNAYERFRNGFDFVQPAVGVAAQKMRSCYLHFASPITLGRGDELYCTFSFNSGFSANVATGSSFLDISWSPSTSFEHGIPVIRSKVVATNATEQSFVGTNGVKRIEFLNFDQDNWNNPVLQNIAVTSNRLAYSATFRQLLASDAVKFPMNKAYRFGTALPVVAAAPTVFMGFDWLPQCMTLFETGRGELLDDCFANLTFTGANVNASQNYVVYEALVRDPRNAQRAINMISRDARSQVNRVLNR